MFEVTFTSPIRTATYTFETYSEALDSLGTMFEGPSDVGGQKFIAKYRATEQNITISGPYQTQYTLTAN